MSNIAWILLALAVGWLLQLGLAWRQARRFYAAVARLRRQGGRVAVGMGRRRMRKAYVALAVHGVTVTDALVLAGTTVFASGRPEPLLVGRRVGDLAQGRGLAELPAQVRLAATQAAGFLAGKATAGKEAAGKVTAANATAANATAGRAAAGKATAGKEAANKATADQARAR